MKVDYYVALVNLESSVEESEFYDNRAEAMDHADIWVRRNPTCTATVYESIAEIRAKVDVEVVEPDE